MIKIKIVALLFTLLLLGGCSSPGPMQMTYGPMNTPVFEPIILDTLKDGSNTVLFKEWTTMYENKELRLWGVFFITDKGMYLANWDMSGYQYNLRYRLPIQELESVSDDTVVRSMWVDSNLLIIKDNTGHEVGFALNGKNAVRSILREISTQ